MIQFRLLFNSLIMMPPIKSLQTAALPSPVVSQRTDCFNRSGNFFVCFYSILRIAFCLVLVDTSTSVGYIVANRVNGADVLDSIHNKRSKIRYVVKINNGTARQIV